MSATRRLDILALIGGMLAVSIVAALIGWAIKNAFSKNPQDAIQAIVRTMPKSDVRADLQASVNSASGPSFKPDVQELRQGIRDFPNSARLHFRLATSLTGPRSSAELERTMKLDPRNALPVYLLAANASAAGRWDESARLLSIADPLSRMDGYNADIGLAGGNLLGEVSIIAAISAARFPIYAELRRLAKDVGQRSLQVHEQQSHKSRATPEALRQLAMVKRMGWKLVESKDATVMDAMVGTAIVTTCQTTARRIFTQLGDKAALAGLQPEQDRLIYIRAGGKWYVGVILRDRTAQGKMQGAYQAEQAFVRDLVAGNITVPEKYIREERKREAARKK